MNKFIEVIKAIWQELDSVIEFFVYLGITYGIMVVFKVSYAQAILSVYGFFVICLLRILVSKFSK